MKKAIIATVFIAIASSAFAQNVPVQEVTAKNSNQPEQAGNNAKQTAKDSTTLPVDQIGTPRGLPTTKPHATNTQLRGTPRKPDN